MYSIRDLMLVAKNIQRINLSTVLVHLNRDPNYKLFLLPAQSRVETHETESVASHSCIVLVLAFA